MKTFLKISKLFVLINSENEETDSEYDRNEENCENEKIAIMAKFKTFLDVYKNTFFNHVEKLMKGETSKVQSCRFNFCTRTTSALIQRKAEQESEIWSNIYGLFTYCLRCHPNASFRKPFVKWRTSLSFYRREEHGLYGNLFFPMNYLKSISKHTHKMSTEEFNYQFNLSRRGF